MNNIWNDIVDGLMDKVNIYRFVLDIMLYFWFMEINEICDFFLFFMFVLFFKVIVFFCNYWKSNSYMVIVWF